MIPPLASRFVAGESAATALERARDLNDRDVGAICNRLGEHYDDREQAEADATAYRRLVDDVADAGLRACVSVKPSQLGLDVEDDRRESSERGSGAGERSEPADSGSGEGRPANEEGRPATGEDVFREHLATVVDRAAERGVFVWLDMEDHTTTDATLDAFEHHALGTDGGVGVCVQSNLRRTPEDLERLADLPGKVRLVKGAYAPPPEVAYREAEQVNARYREDLRYAFEQFDDGVAVGSHDPEMLSLARSLHEELGTPYEVQMLMGVREDALFELAEDVPAWQYVPYGDRWPSYFYRRVVERKENAFFALRALLGI